MAASLVAIPTELLADLELPDAAKDALATGRCPDCGKELQVLDTWERVCECGYGFDYYHTSLITAPLPPEAQVRQHAEERTMTSAEHYAAMVDAYNHWVARREQAREDRWGGEMAQLFKFDPRRALTPDLEFIAGYLSGEDVLVDVGGGADVSGCR